jgi:hypothetical protein
MTAITKIIKIKNCTLSDNTYLENRLYYFSFKINQSDVIKVPIEFKNYTQINYFDLISNLKKVLDRYGIFVRYVANGIEFSISDIDNTSLEIIEDISTIDQPYDNVNITLSKFMDNKQNWLWTHIKDYYK